MKTASWFTKLPPDHQPIGVSRGVPPRQAASYRLYRKLSPGPLFNSVSPEEYDHLYRTDGFGWKADCQVLGEKIENPSRLW